MQPYGLSKRDQWGSLIDAFDVISATDKRQQRVATRVCRDKSYKRKARQDAKAETQAWLQER